MRMVAYKWEKEEVLNSLTAEECRWAIELLQQRLGSLTTEDKGGPINTSIEDLNLSNRVYCVLSQAKLRTIKDILNYGLDRLWQLRGAGEKTVEDIRCEVEKRLKQPSTLSKSSS